MVAKGNPSVMSLRRWSAMDDEFADASKIKNYTVF